MLDALPGYLRQLTCKPVFELSRLVGVLLCPSLFLFISSGSNSFQFFEASLVECFHFGEDDERLVGIATEVCDGVAESIAAKRGTMRLAVAFVAAAVVLQSAFAHDAMTDDERRLAFHGFCLVERPSDLLHVVAVDVNHFPAKRTISHRHVFASHHFSLCRKLYVVGVIEHDKVVEP